MVPGRLFFGTLKTVQGLILDHMFVWGAYINTPMIYPGTKFQGHMTSPSDVTDFLSQNLDIFENMTLKSFYKGALQS